MTLRFEFPNGEQNTPYRWASFVEGSSTPFTVYGNLGSAKNSIRHRAMSYGSKTTRNSKILELVDGVWYVLFDIPKDTPASRLPWYRRRVNASYVKNPEFVNYRETPNVRSHLREEREYFVPESMTREEYAEWRLAVEREANAAK